MKLLTHNVLSSKGIKGVKSGYPLKIEVNFKMLISQRVMFKLQSSRIFQAKDVKVCEAEFNPEFIARVITRLDWPVIVKAAKDLGHGSDLPTELPEHYETENDFLKKAHHVLMEIDIINGDLVCPETGRRFPVSDGIPNMLLNEDEV